MIPNHQDTDTEAERDSAWQEFLHDYSRGDYSPRAAPHQPLTALHTQEADPRLLVQDFYDSSVDPLATARKVRQHYEHYQFLPPPRSATERDRSRVIADYALRGPEQKAVMDRAADLAGLFFEGAMVTMSLFSPTKQLVISVGGDQNMLPNLAGKSVPTDDSLCGHVALRRDNLVVDIPETSADWRFRQNFWCKDTIKGYRACSVTLPKNAWVDCPERRAEESIVVGVLALLYPTAQDPISDKGATVLKRLCESVSRDLESTFQGFRRARETLMRDSVSAYLTRTLASSSIKKQSNRNSGFQQVKSERQLHEGLPSAEKKAQEAIEVISSVLQTDLCMILDVSALLGKVNNPSNESRLKILAQSADQSIPADQVDEALHASYDSLVMFVKSRQSEMLYQEGSESGLERLLPNTVSAHMAQVFFTRGQPHLLFIVASTSAAYTYSTLDATYLSNIGSVLLASLARARMEEQDAAKTAFVSSISHELRTPIHCLLSQNELLRDAINSNNLASAHALLDTAEHCGLALRDITEDVLESTKLINSGGSPASHDTKSEVDIAEIVMQTAQMCAARGDLSKRVYEKAASASADVQLSVAVQKNTSWRANFEAASLRRILLNLIQNALKYTYKGQVVVSLWQGQAKLPGGSRTISLEVKDSGIGIPDSFLGQLYEPFVQADQFASGAGLGLYITRAIVSRLAGSIQVDSKLDVGSTFRVDIPVDFLDKREVSSDRAEMERTIIIGSQDKASSSSGSSTPTPKAIMGTCNSDEPLSRLRVLIVEDNPISRRVLCTLAKNRRLQYREACDGVEAVEQFQDYQPHIVWTDVSMPRLNGVEAAVQMRDLEKSFNWPRSRITVVTGLGSSDEDVKDEALNGPAQVDLWLVKGKIKLQALIDDLEEYFTTLQPATN